MGIPVFISEVRAAATDTIQSGGGSVQILPATQYYFLVSNKGTVGNGRSLLAQMEASLALSGGAVWTVVLTADLKIRFTHNAGGATNLVLNRVLAWKLGCAMVFATTYPPDPALTITISVPSGPVGYVAEFRSPWLWCPERWVNSVGPQYFNWLTDPGVPKAGGSMAQSPDGSTSTVRTGITYDAVFFFKGVEYIWRARPSDFNYSANNPHEREDCETWWRLGPSLGRRVLFWRDKTSLPGSSAPLGNSTIARPYVEYYPDPATMRQVSIVSSDPPNEYYFDITLGFTLTERGGTSY